MTRERSQKIFDDLQANFGGGMSADFAERAVSLIESHLQEMQQEGELLRELVREALAMANDFTDEHDGRDIFGLNCGSCEAGIPMPHSWGCAARRALGERPA